MTPWASFDKCTHQTNKGAMIREEIRVLYLYLVTFSMTKPLVDLFSQDLKILMSVIVMFMV